jgi:hypothetical protein
MGSGGGAPPFLIAIVCGGEWSASGPRHFTAPGTHWIGCWVGCRVETNHFPVPGIELEQSPG